MGELLLPSTHLIIPDTQIAPGVPTQHLEWIGQYIVDRFAERATTLTVVHLGDHWDMPSLSWYDRGKRSMEGRRYIADIDAGNAGFDKLNAPLAAYNRARGRKSKFTPRRILLLGNHEYRIERAAESDAQLEGAVGLHHLNAEDHGWEVHEFLRPVIVDGVHYAHYFYNPMTGRPYSGSNIENRLRTIGHSFTMGHQQGLLMGVRYVGGRSQHALVAGSCYLHDEDYKGPQGNTHWRGVVVAHGVRDGSYDIMTVSLDFLARKYEGMSLEDFTAKYVDPKITKSYLRKVAA